MEVNDLTMIGASWVRVASDPRQYDYFEVYYSIEHERKDENTICSDDTNITMINEQLWCTGTDRLHTIRRRKQDGKICS